MISFFLLKSCFSWNILTLIVMIDDDRKWQKGGILDWELHDLTFSFFEREAHLSKLIVQRKDSILGIVFSNGQILWFLGHSQMWKPNYCNHKTHRNRFLGWCGRLLCMKSVPSIYHWIFQGALEAKNIGSCDSGTINV